MHNRYAPEQRWLHWLIVALVLTQLVLGALLANAPPNDADYAAQIYGLHGGTGLVIFLVMLWRLSARLRHGAPPLPLGTPGLVSRLAHANHYAFYLLLLLEPVIGYLVGGAKGYPLSVYGLFTIPAAIGKSDQVAELLEGAHGVVAGLLVLLIALHVAGVIYHTFIRRDRLLARMT
jgi:cytochrome b561